MTDATPLASEQITPETFLAQLRRVNTDRYQAWIGDADDAGILFDAAELGGEVGELLNVVKKLEREARGWRGSRAAPEDFADECADVLICLDKLARRMDVDLEAATIRKFNATSDKVGLPQRLSATPVPGDQDASQAQGEVPAWQEVLDAQEAECRQLRKALIAMGRMIPGVLLADDVSSDFLATLPDEMAHYHLHSAPGATAQDGVEVDDDGPCTTCDDTGMTIQTERPCACEEGDQFRTPTPTIPAGMVAWNGGDSAPEDWDFEQPVLLRDGYKVKAKSLHWGHNNYLDGRRDVIAYTPLAAAPKQAEQQGVERAQEALDEACALIQEAKGFAGPGYITDHLDFAESWLNEINLAALNAPTGAVEREPGCESVLTALRNLRRSIEETGAKHSTPALKEAFDQATIVLGRGY
ncbi:MAG: MazG-like family protein [Sphingomonas phyllosphaerae]|uniref:MazG-like family protein n=1 Tax=Sphingomonas phyllosphaerae TaxID=257003 RepID=UPI002FFA3644